MQLTLSFEVYGMGLLDRVKRSEPYPLAVYLDLSTKPTSIWSHANDLQFAMRRAMAAILKIDAVRGVSKVIPAVIRRIAVYMVNLIGGPDAGNHEPDNTVGFIVSPINVNLNAPLRIDASSNRSGPAATSTRTSPEKSIPGLINVEFAQSIGCNLLHVRTLPLGHKDSNGFYRRFS